jgi:EAL domain-containing protein (putative c-di-GMP-specific phosphodiesterase class I)/GGDEF domain-containing protein
VQLLENGELVSDPEHLTFIFSNIQEAVIMEDSNRAVKWANRAFADIFAPGVPPEALVGGDCDQAAVAAAPMFINPEAWLERTREIVAAKERVLHEEWECADGRWLDRDYFPRVVDGKVLEHMWVYRDTTESHGSGSIDAARSNPVSAIAHRELEAAAEQLAEDVGDVDMPSPVSIVLIKLLILQRLNNEFGSAMGDALISEVLSRIGEGIQGARVERIRGATIAIATRRMAPEAIFARVHEVLDPSLQVKGETISLRYALGGANGLVGSSADVSVLLDDAFFAVVESGAKFMDVICDDELRNRGRTRRDVESRLRTALISDEFELHYQPVMRLESREIIGAESLIRWRHPERGLLGAGEFIPVVEDLGLIALVDLWVIDQVCSDLDALMERGISHVSINISPQTLASHEDVTKALLDKLDHTHHTPDQIVIEITETAVSTDVTRSIEGMRTLSRAGFPIAIDDFGVGTSSFALLKDLPFAFLKLDKSFVIDLEQERVQRLIEAICAMAGVLGGVVVAEGIEELWQLETLRTCGVDIGQGWYIGKPLPLNELPR